MCLFQPLPTPPLELREARKRKVAKLDRQLKSLNAAVPRKRKEADRLANELSSLEARGTNSMSAARDARKRKEARLRGAEDDFKQGGGGGGLRRSC
jgi:septal ring factor EnvC (AmiA/AmiB activator)